MGGRHASTGSQITARINGRGLAQKNVARLLLALATKETVMSKGMDQKRSEKKKPQKTLQEKRAAKREKKANKR